MTRRGSVIVYAALLLGVAAAWLVSSSAASLGAAVLLCLVPLLSLAWNLLSRRTATAALTVQTFAQKEETVRGTLRVQFGGGFVPAGSVTADVRLHNALTGEMQRTPLTLSPDGRMYTASFTFASAHCGCVRCSVGSVRLWDVFFLLSVRAPSGQSARCTVLPRTFPVELSDPALPNASGEADTFLPVGGGSDFTEVYQFREYVPGDDVRGIHWLLGAKQDALIYRDPALAVRRSLLLFWEQTDAPPEVVDALAEAVFSVSQALSEQGIPFSLAIPQGDALRTEAVSDMDMLSALLPLLLRGGQTTAYPDIRAFGRTLWFTSSDAPDDPSVLAICCTVDGNAACRGIVCTPKTVRQTLQRLDWEYER